jgi:IMP dehydrogenase
MELKEYLEYDDVLLVPSRSDIRYRSTIGLSNKYDKLWLDTPIFAAPMDSLSSENFIEQMDKAGGLGFVHRFATKEERIKQIHSLYGKGVKFGVSVGLLDNKDEFEIAFMSNNIANIICIDVANGHNWHTLKSVEVLKYNIEKYNNKSFTMIMAGNVASVEGFADLYKAGARLIRVGIGSGSVCTTRNMTGVGVPQVTLISEISDFIDSLHDIETETTRPYLIADGGIKYPGDIVKALALGADGVMLGYLLSGAKECPNHSYRGMASRNAQWDRFGFIRSVEGIEIRAKNNGTPLIEIMNGIKDNIKSGLSYIGSDAVSNAKCRAKFVRVTRNAIKEL